jgi:hypothetical protein
MSVPLPGTVLVVLAVGPDCPLTVGEHVTAGQPRFIDILSGDVSGITVTRENGEQVKVVRGPAGAIFDDPRN